MLPRSGQIEVAQSQNPRELYGHQQNAIKALDRANQKPFRGLLVLPTGGGKTLTAVHWLLRTFIARQGRVLWVAHRHELLNQALTTVQNCAYQDLLQNRTSFRYRVISGHPDHDTSVNIQADDDILIASKDSLNFGIGYLLENWLDQAESLLLVIDEAHHATAKTYQKLISKLDERLKERGRELRMLGLTATPMRTDESEQGLLKLVFPDDIIFAESLQRLIAIGILAEPKFESLLTQIKAKENLTAQDLKHIENFDSLPKAVAEKLALSNERNRFIVDTYLKNRDRYCPVLVFAIDIDHAIALNSIFKQHQVKSDYVVSSICDADLLITISPEENSRKLEQFRSGELEVLINVEMLTEGTDLPNVQTVFLTRPTASSTLMTQMIGRALRGSKAGGTTHAYIVSFIDEWEDKINWVNPEKLHTSDNTFVEDEKEYKQKVTRLISIEKIEEFARMLDETVDTSELEHLSFLERMPLGLYCFSILEPSKADHTDFKSVNYEVLVYSDSMDDYLDFIDDLDFMFKIKIDDMGDREELTQSELNSFTRSALNNYFANPEKRIGFYEHDIRNILRFYAQTESRPPFLENRSRKQCNLAEVARKIYDDNMSQMERIQYLDSIWDSENTFWRLLFNYDRRYFDHQLFVETQKVETMLRNNRDASGSFHPLPQIISDPLDPKKMTLHQLKTHFPSQYSAIRNAVNAKHRKASGEFCCAISNYCSHDRRQFQIDHIKPMMIGGLTVLENLQLLSREAHAKKTQEDNRKYRDRA